MEVLADLIVCSCQSTNIAIFHFRQWPMFSKRTLTVGDSSILKTNTKLLAYRCIIIFTITVYQFGVFFDKQVNRVM